MAAGAAVALGGTLYQEMPAWAPDWLSTSAARNPHSGEKTPGVALAPPTGSIVSLCDVKYWARVTSPFVRMRGTLMPLGSATCAAAPLARRTAAVSKEEETQKKRPAREFKCVPGKTLPFGPLPVPSKFS